jgi:hypothetical protein
VWEAVFGVLEEQCNDNYLAVQSRGARNRGMKPRSHAFHSVWCGAL